MKKSLLLTTVIMLITVTILSAQAVDQTFNTSGTYTVPTGYNAIAKIEVWGGGGGGGSNTGGQKGGGGGGAYASSTLLLSAGSYTVTIGSGGGPGVAGGTSSFGTLVIAAGGSSTTGTTGGAGGTTAASTGTTTFAGGKGGNAGSGGFLGSGGGGGGGGSATSSANGSDGSNGGSSAGGNGGAGQGTGGKGGNSIGTSAAVGNAPGAGGGGKGSLTSSQSGADGRVVITVTSSASLPVMYNDVRAYAKNNGVQIEWSNLTERDLKEYAVERSSNGRNFHDISIYMPISNQNNKADYTSFDASPVAGTNFYRIRATEIGGKVIYSKVLRVDMSGKQSFSMYPNPVTGRQLTVSLTGMAQGSYNIRIINTNGQDVYQKTIRNASSSTSEMIELPASVKAGIYTMLINGDTFTATKLFVVK